MQYSFQNSRTNKRHEDQHHYDITDASYKYKPFQWMDRDQNIGEGQNIYNSPCPRKNYHGCVFKGRAHARNLEIHLNKKK